MSSVQIRVSEQKTQVPTNGAGGDNHGRPRGRPRKQVDQASLDEQKLLKLVPDEDGASVGGNKLREQLGWDTQYYREVLHRLVDKEVLAVGRGRGGSVYRLKPSASARPRKNKAVPENKLYEPMMKALREWWSTLLDANRLIVQDTHKGGKNAGEFTRPDITVVAVTKYKYVPEKSLDVVTFEVKPEGRWSLVGVYEAASHARFATQSYLLIHAPKGKESIPPQKLEHLEEACIRFNVGLGVFQKPDSYSTYEILLDPTDQKPSPDKMDRFIKESLPERTREKLRDWLGLG